MTFHRRRYLTWFSLFGILWLPLNAQQYVANTFAGGGPGDQPAITAGLGSIGGLTFDAAANIYFAYHSRIFKLDGSGNLTVVAGKWMDLGNAQLVSGDGGLATQATIHSAIAIVVDGQGNLFFSDGVNVRKVAAGTGIISTLFAGPVGASESDLALDAQGNLYVAYQGCVVCAKTGVDKIATNGAMTHVAGSDGQLISSLGVDNVGTLYLGTYDMSGNDYTYKLSGGQATLYNTGHWITRFDSNGNGYTVDFNGNRVLRYAPGGQSFTVVAGTGVAGFAGDGSSATAAELRNPQTVAVQPNGNFVVYDNYRLREVVNGIINTVAGNGSVAYGGDGGWATNAQLTEPQSIALDHSGNLYISDSGNYRIRKVDATSGLISTVAGTGNWTPPDGSPAGTAALSANIQPFALAIDSAGTIYYSQPASVHKVAGGLIETVSPPASVPGAFSSGPTKLAVDGAGNLYYGSSAGSVGKIASNNTVTLLAGTNTSNPVGAVEAIAVDAAGANVYYIDASGVLKKVSSGGGAASTVASGFSVVGGLAIDLDGSVLISDVTNNEVKRISSGGTITIVAGTGTPGFNGDGMPALSTELAAPYGLAVDTSGRIFVADSINFRVRYLSSGTSVTIATNVPGLDIDVDGVPAVAPQTYGWTAGSTHTIGATSPQALNGMVYSFASWSDGGAESHAVSAPGSATTLTASFNVSASISAIALSPSKLQFGYSGQQITGTQTVALNFSPSAPISWTASSNQSKITVSPTSGTGSAVLQITAAPGASGMITVSAGGATNSPQQIPVSVTSASPAMPFGSFDTPITNTTGIAGAIPVTGWALDNIQVTNVGIWREPVVGETAQSNGLVFIGNAVFVAGSRTDVQATYPNTPFNYSAGWGYMLLTNFLVNASGSGPLGNGTYKLHALVTNLTGQTLDLGTRTITVDNAHATKPFGTIDTPAQGGTAAGNAYVNFGWALTQNPYVIPLDGSTINVFVDGVPVGHPTYNQYRSDIANLFPGLANSNGAVGYFYLDTTTLANGVHTIAWSVSDNAGRSDGIGSRFFTVANTGAGNVPAAEAIAPAQITADATGVYSVSIEQLDRIELPVGAVNGYLLMNEERQPLPVGSTLKGGRFYWQAGLGFLGDYDLLFERPDSTVIRVHVKIRPKAPSLQ